MSPDSPRSLGPLTQSRLRLVILATCVLPFASGCGNGSKDPSFTGNTEVTVIASSTANGQLARFGIVLQSLTLTSDSGASATVISTPLHLEFMHLNATAEPLATASIPQGIYTSATASIGYSDFTCLALGANGNDYTDIFADTSVPPSAVSIKLPGPLTITGSTAALSLELQVSPSASVSSCIPNGTDPYTITPTFTLGLGTGSQNAFAGLGGMITAANGNALTITSPEGASGGGLAPANAVTWQVSVNGSTVLNGIASATQLSIGMAVDFDAALQRDGSLLATRIAVYDQSTSNVSLWEGPLVRVQNVAPALLYAYPQSETGPILNGGTLSLETQNTTFAVSTQAGSLADLPFSASFNASNMVAGQNAAITFDLPAFPANQDGPEAATITLIPQTLNGNVVAASQQGSFKIYIIQLAPYDLFPTFSVQNGQTTLLNDPSTVAVYAVPPRKTW